MKIFQALAEQAKKRDDTPMERLEYNKVLSTIETYCETYLHSANDILKLEILPSAIDAALACIESRGFLEKYEFTQESESIFLFKLRELDMLGF